MTIDINLNNFIQTHAEGRGHAAALIAEEDSMFEEDYNTAFVKTLLRVQNNIVNMPNGKEHFDIYLAEAIYPTLVPALEGLAREIDRLTSSEGMILFTHLLFRAN